MHAAPPRTRTRDRATDETDASHGQFAAQSADQAQLTAKAKGCLSGRTGSRAPTSSRAGCSRTTSISRTALTRGLRKPTAARTARLGRSWLCGSQKKPRGCDRCRSGCRTPMAAMSCASRRSRSSGSIATTTRSTGVCCSARLGPRLPDRDHRDRSRHGRARRGASVGVRRRSDDHRSGASNPARAPAGHTPPASPGRGRDPAVIAL
jgi:hypothetical protein